MPNNSESYLFGRSESGTEPGDLKLSTSEEKPPQPFTNPFKREEPPSESPMTAEPPTISPSEVGIALGKWGGGLGAAAKAKWGQFRRKGKEGEGRADGKMEGTARLEKV